jgi:hypothetical protein
MKRIWFSLIFLAAAISLCVFEQIELHRDFHIVIGTAENAIAAESREEKAQYCKELEKEWEHIHNWAALTTDHSILHGTEIAVAQAVDLSETEYTDETDEALIEAKSELEQIHDGIVIKIENIF